MVSGRKWEVIRCGRQGQPLTDHPHSASEVLLALLLFVGQEVGRGLHVANVGGGGPAIGVGHVLTIAVEVGLRGDVQVDVRHLVAGGRVVGEVFVVGRVGFGSRAPDVVGGAHANEEPGQVRDDDGFVQHF